ncbi:hypothetical protein [Celeribacter naphthalenivorans]|nr:hypothetical protein [Celeribacter naphthalenivorans]
MIVQELLTEIFGPPACFSGALSVFAREKGDDWGDLKRVFREMKVFGF